MSVVVMLGFTACEFDNYDAPSYEFNGQLVTDDGQPFLFDANKTLFKFYQTGFGKDDPGMNMTVDNNGGSRIISKMAFLGILLFGRIIRSVI